jgi:hypothetical protein
MILRPLHPLPPVSKQPVSAWEAVLHAQTRTYEDCWMITQPSHAVLAGELAATISAPQFPVLDAPLLQAISLHDAGWGIPDAQAIMKSRAVHPHAPPSFVAASVEQFVEAWTKSIDICEPISPAGGYIVSRHFWRLGQERLHSMPEENRQDRRPLDSFLKNETRRQKKLATAAAPGADLLEQLTDLLQICDLLSLYICSGASESVIFPEYFGVQLRVSNQDECYKFDPPVLRSGAELAVAALRYPTRKEESSREIKIKIG